MPFLCDYLGISRQGYYRHVDRTLETDVLRTSIVLYCQEVLHDMPKAGMRDLYYLSRRKFGDKFIIGRDQCFNILRSNGLVQRKRKRPRTTNSNHNFRIYPDLLNTSPKLKAIRFGQLCVADITYVATNSGWAYLSLVTDAASRLIVGWALHPTLAKEGPMKAINSAMDFYKQHGANLSALIHHSDRGVQYCCNEYVETLKNNDIKISMTQKGNPLNNALAERMNNTVKNGWLFDTEDKTYDEVERLTAKAVYVYNNIRPHQALEMHTPMEEMKRLLGTVA